RSTADTHSFFLPTHLLDDVVAALRRGRVGRHALPGSSSTREQASDHAHSYHSAESDDQPLVPMHSFSSSSSQPVRSRSRRTKSPPQATRFGSDDEAGSPPSRIMLRSPSEVKATRPNPFAAQHD